MIKTSRKKISLFVMIVFVFFVVLETFPGNLSSEQEGLKLLKKGEMLHQDLKYEAALEQYKIALPKIKSKENLSRLYFNLSITHYALGNREESEKFLTELFKLKPGFDLDEDNHAGEFIKMFNRIKSKAVDENKTDQKDVDKKDGGENVIPKKAKKKKKKLYWSLVIGGVVAVIAAYLIIKKIADKKKENNKYTLTVNKGDGVEGTPDSGSTTYDEGAVVNYSYSLKSGYKDLVVTLDGSEVSSSGSVEMNANHTLTATSSAQTQSCKIVFSSSRSGNNDIWIMDEDGSGQVQLTFNNDNETHPSFSSDGSQIAYINYDSKKLMIMNVDGSNKKVVYTSTTHQIAMSAWSPCGNQILFRQGDYNHYDIWIINANGTSPQNLTNDGMHNGIPSWSPDCSQIVYSARETPSYSYSVELWKMNSDGSNKTQLTSAGSCGYTCENDCPDWSFNGSKIVYCTGKYGQTIDDNMYPHDIWTMNSDGTNKKRITTHPDKERYPKWSPDNTRIAFIRNGDIYVINVSGTGETRLTNTGNNGLGDWYR